MAARKHRVITLDQKLKIIDDLRKDKSHQLDSDTYGVPKSTIGDIWKEQDKIENYVSMSDCPSIAKKKCIIRKAKFEELEKVCFMWFMQQHSKGALVSGPLLKEKALQLFYSIYPESSYQSFVVSSGWLTNFISQHGIKGISLQGESMSADTSQIDSLKDELFQKMTTGGYSLDQVFNADKTGLWWKLMSSKSLVHCGEKQAKNFKKPKDRVTLLGCCNASGSCKIPLAFIHKSARPHCFKNVDMNSLPVCYLSQPKAWMDTALFK